MWLAASGIFLKAEPTITMFATGAGWQRPCLRRMLLFKREGALHPGVLTPEQVFALHDVLPEGDFPEYSLRVESSAS